MNEVRIRFLLGKCTSDDLIQGYIKAVQGHIMPKLDMSANIHILIVLIWKSILITRTMKQNAAFLFTNKFLSYIIS